MTNTNKDRDGDESKTPTREDVARIIAEAHANIYESDPLATEPFCVYESIASRLLRSFDMRMRS